MKANEFLKCDSGAQVRIHAIQAHLILLCFTDIAFFFFFNKLKVCDNPVLSKSISTLFPTAFDHLCLSHCGNSPNISDFFIICIMVIFDVTIVKRLQLDLLKALMMLTFFSNKVFLRYIHSLGIMLFFTLKDYKIV